MNAAVYYGPNDIRVENLEIKETPKNNMNHLRVHYPALFVVTMLELTEMETSKLPRQ